VNDPIAAMLVVVRTLAPQPPTPTPPDPVRVR
jgi:hypothetical protein